MKNRRPTFLLFRPYKRWMRSLNSRNLERFRTLSIFGTPVVMLSLSFSSALLSANIVIFVGIATGIAMMSVCMSVETEQRRRERFQTEREFWLLRHGQGHRTKAARWKAAYDQQLREERARARAFQRKGGWRDVEEDGAEDEVRAPRWYEVLGISPHATREEARRAFAKLMMRYHPDHNPGVDGTEAAKLSEAWEIIREQKGWT